MSENGIRLQKYLSSCGIISRRKAEEEIIAGNITVNGKPAELGTRIDPKTDSVEYFGEKVESRTNENVCIMLNKPKGVVCTMEDEKGRKTVKELVSDLGIRVYPCGRLDLNSEGLLLMTNDGDLANRLMHPKHHIPKEYKVRVKETVTEDQLDVLNEPMLIDGYKTRPATVIFEGIGKDGSSSLTFILREGRNRQIRKMCETVGLSVVNLKRTAIGNIKLGRLKSGAYTRLTDEQIRYLKEYGKER